MVDKFNHSAGAKTRGPLVPEFLVICYIENIRQLLEDVMTEEDLSCGRSYFSSS